MVPNAVMLTGGRQAIVKDDMLVICVIMDMNSGALNHSVNRVSRDVMRRCFSHDFVARLLNAPFCCLGMPRSRLILRSATDATC